MSSSLNGAAYSLADAADLMAEMYGLVDGELFAVGIAGILLKPRKRNICYEN